MILIQSKRFQRLFPSGILKSYALLWALGNVCGRFLNSLAGNVMKLLRVYREYRLNAIFHPHVGFTSSKYYCV